MATPGNKKKKNPDEDEIFYAPEITREPVSRQFILGGKISLRIQANGRPVPSFQWYINGRKLSGANSDRLTINKSRREHGGQYSCEAKNFVGSVMSRAATVSFLSETIPELVIEPSVASIPVGKPFKFRLASPTGDKVKRLKLQWMFNGKRVTGATGPELQLTQMKKKYEGEYKVIMVIAGEVHASNRVTLKALPAEGVEELQPALTKEKTVFLVAPPPEDFFFDPSADPDPNDSLDQLTGEISVAELLATLEPEVLPKNVGTPPLSETTAPSSFSRSEFLGKNSTAPRTAAPSSLSARTPSLRSPSPGISPSVDSTDSTDDSFFNPESLAEPIAYGGEDQLSSNQPVPSKKSAPKPSSAPVSKPVSVLTLARKKAFLEKMLARWPAGRGSRKAA